MPVVMQLLIIEMNARLVA